MGCPVRVTEIGEDRVIAARALANVIDDPLRLVYVTGATETAVAAHAIVDPAVAGVLVTALVSDAMTVIAMVGALLVIAEVEFVIVPRKPTRSVEFGAQKVDRHRRVTAIEPAVVDALDQMPTVPVRLPCPWKDVVRMLVPLLFSMMQHATR